MIPAYKIETLTGAVLDHTITTEANFRFKEVLTDTVGYFSFTVPTKKIDYVFNDIALNDKVKIYVGDDAVSATPNFIGRVYDISAPLKAESGFMRVISGLSQGEILLRRHKSNKNYTGTNASVIVAEWANDLGLGVGDITADVKQPDIEVRTKTYWDLLRQISDYWIDGANQIKKDFYVDVDFDLVWKVRPLRSGATVETFTVGKNINWYTVTEKIEQVKNNITVYGVDTKPLPEDKDIWTEVITNWTASVGSVALSAIGPKRGTKTIMGDDDGGQTSTFKRDITRITIRDINKLTFWYTLGANHTANVIRLHAPDVANSFEAHTSDAQFFTLNEFGLGPNYEYDAIDFPSNPWTKNGSPNWWDIKYIQFHATWAIANRVHAVDGLWFYPERWSDTATNAGSITSYEQRDLEIVDDKLHTDGECEQRSETLLFQLKDAPKQITLATKGNTNVLIGDRLSMTLPAENISAVNFDIMSVEHIVNPQVGWQTVAVMVDSGNIRAPIVNKASRERLTLNRRLRELAIEVRELR